MNSVKVSFIFLVASVLGGIYGKSLEENSDSIYASSVRDCKNDYSTNCFKLDIANFVERIGKVSDVKLIKGISLIKDQDSNDTSTADIVAGTKPWIKVFLQNL